MKSDVGADDGEESNLPLSNLNGETLKKIIEYCEYHASHPTETANVEGTENDYRTDNISDWDKNFMSVEMKLLFDIILAANFLDIKPLLDLGCKTVANLIKGKTPEEVKSTFAIKK